MDSLFLFIIKIAVLIFSVVIHEVSHGFAALALGDTTAKYMGRLTLNPLRHLDVWGSFVVPMLSLMLGGFIFGWAKPVPYNPHNLRDQRYGPAIVGAAGPLSNILIAAIFGFALRLLPVWVSAAPSEATIHFLQGFGDIFQIIVMTNIVLAVFNLVPIPPLDGSKLLFAALPYRYAHVQAFMERYGMFLLILFIFYGFRIIMPLMEFLYRLIVGQKLFF